MAENTRPPLSAPTPVQTTKVSPFVTMMPRDFVGAVIGGAVAGLIVAAVALLMNRFVFGAVLCREGAATECAQAPLYAVIVAVVVGSIAGTVALARLRVFRPLLVVLATVIALWSMHFWFFEVAWYWALIISAFIYALAYGVFTWIARIRSFILALVVVVVLVVALRLLLQS